MFCRKKYLLINFFYSAIIFLSTTFASEKSPYKNKIVFINGSPITKINSKDIKIDKQYNTLYLNNSLKNFFARYYINENGIKIDEAYFFRNHDNLKMKIGKFSIEHFYKNHLSTGDMIDSGNALGLTRYYLEYSKILGQFEIKVSLHICSK